MLVSGKSVLLDARRRGYACGAFNFNNMEFLQGILEAAEEEQKNYDRRKSAESNAHELLHQRDHAQHE